MRLSVQLILLLTILCNTVQAGFIPIIGRYDGAGSAYGLGYQTEFSGYNILLGGVTGDANAFGATISKYFTEDFELSVGMVSFSDVVFTTTYQRNLNDDTNEIYNLGLKGSAFGVGSKLWLFDDYLTFKLSGLQSVIQFGKYYDEEGVEVQLPEANLFDITTTEIKVGLDINLVDNARSPSYGAIINSSVAQISGRVGQSDQTILDYGIKGIIPMLKYFNWVLKAQFSDAIVSVNKNYDTDAEVRAALAANCGSIVDPTQQARCLKLENDLVAYIQQNNTVGTAKGLGGNVGLRSFREQRFKARHTALYSAEFYSNLSDLFGVFNKDDQRLSLVLFFDHGYANDDKLVLFDKVKSSNGLALKFAKGSGAVILQAAIGSDDSSSWSLGLGSAF